MMSHPDLLPEVDVSTLGPLVPPEVVDHMERKYVVKVRVSELGHDVLERLLWRAGATDTGGRG